MMPNVLRKFFVQKKQTQIATLNSNKCLLQIVLFNLISSYRKIYLQMNNTARIYISGVIFLALPQIKLMIT